MNKKITKSETDRLLCEYLNKGNKIKKLKPAGKPDLMWIPKSFITLEAQVGDLMKWVK